MPNVRASSATIGTTRLPSSGWRESVVRMRTNAIVVEISRWPEPLSAASNSLERRRLDRLRARAARGQVAAERLPALVHVADLGAVVGRLVERRLGDPIVGNRNAVAIAEDAQRVLAHLLLLMGDVLALAGLAHPVALHGLGEDHGRLAGVLGGRGVGGVDLLRVVAAAVELPDVVVGHVRDHLEQLGVLPEEVLARVGAAAHLVVLVVAVDRLFHALEQQALACRARAAGPSGRPRSP